MVECEKETIPEELTVEERYYELYDMADLMFMLGESENAHRCLIIALALVGSPFTIHSFK